MVNKNINLFTQHFYRSQLKNNLKNKNAFKVDTPQCLYVVLQTLQQVSREEKEK